MIVTNDFLNGICNGPICQFQANGVSVDSREVRVGDIFIAIKWPTLDGHSFVFDALQRGAAVAVVSDPKFQQDKRCIIVPDTSKFLLKLAKKIQLSCSTKIIAITGSAGKTTTREWLSNVLSYPDRKVIQSLKNYNNMIGLPVSLCGLEADTDIGVFELGTNHPGEIRELSLYLGPDTAIITNIQNSHIGNYRNLEELQNEKKSIISGLKPGGLLIFNKDSFGGNLKNLQQISFGFSKLSDVRIVDYSIFKNQMAISLKYNNQIYSLSIKAIGKKYVYTAANIFAYLIAMNEDISPQILQRFSKLTPLPGRGRVLKCQYEGKQFTVIDDAYNASPSSLNDSIDTLIQQEGKRKIAVIGEMKELGDLSYFFHKKLSEKLKKSTIDHLFFIGNCDISNLFDFCETFEQINEKNMEKIASVIQDGDTVLLKGSHSVEIFKIMELFNVL